MLNVSLRSAEIPQSFRHPQVSGTISDYSMKEKVWCVGREPPVVLTICLPENGAGAGAQRISLLEVNSPFKGSTMNGVCVLYVCVLCISSQLMYEDCYGKTETPIRITIQKSLK